MQQLRNSLRFLHSQGVGSSPSPTAPSLWLSELRLKGRDGDGEKEIAERTSLSEKRHSLEDKGVATFRRQTLSQTHEPPYLPSHSQRKERNSVTLKQILDCPDCSPNVIKLLHNSTYREDSDAKEEAEKELWECQHPKLKKGYPS